MSPARLGVRRLQRWRKALIARWLDRRVPPEAPRVRLHRRRLFILPTRLGYTFALTLALLLLGSLNYGTSLGFVVVFLLAGTGAIAMHRTVRNLDGIEIQFGAPLPVFAGEPIELPARLQAGPTRRWAVNLEGEQAPVQALAPGGAAAVDSALAFATRRPGRFRPPRVRIASRWPSGLLRAWSWMWPRVEGIVYPAAVDHGATWPERKAAAGQQRTRRGDDSDLAHLRAYQPGDPPRRIVWRALARNDELLVKAFESSPAGDHWFDWSDLGHLAPDARLQQLCAWVLRADRAGLRYGLALPGEQIEPDTGPIHQRRCLEALALVGEPAAAEG